MRREDLAIYQDYIEEYCYNLLISSPTSKDHSIEYYKMELDKRNATKQDFRKLARYFAEYMAQEIKRGVKCNNKTEEIKITSRCLKKAWKRYLGKHA